MKAGYGAVCALGIVPALRFEDLLTEEYISDVRGSTAEDVVDLLSALGADGMYIEGLGWASLRYTKYPLILHIASDGQLDAANHWVLSLGMEKGQLRIVDGGGAVELWPIERVLARWNGKAIAVAREDAASALPHLGRIESYFFTLLVVAAAATGFLVCHALRGIRQRYRSPAVLCVVFLALQATCYAIGCTAFPLPQNTATRYVLAATQGADAVEISLHELEDLMAGSNSLLIDCRYEADFRYGSLARAINIPIDSTTHEIGHDLREVDRDTKIVLFCMSDRCHFSDVMAVRLAGIGFRNLAIFRGGYLGWKNGRH